MGNITAPSAAQYNIVENHTQMTLNDIFGTPYPADVKYVLAAGSPAKTAGAGGTEAGIYGGAVPAKAQRIPSIPEVVEFTVAGATSPDGSLKANIRVEAQDE